MVTIIGSALLSMMLVKVLYGPAPSMAAASSISRGIPRKNCRARKIYSPQRGATPVKASATKGA